MQCGGIVVSHCTGIEKRDVDTHRRGDRRKKEIMSKRVSYKVPKQEAKEARKETRN